MLTIGASHSLADARQSSSVIMSLRLVEYSRMRPQPVHVRLHVCNGSSCRTMANFGVLRSLFLTMCLAIFAVSARGNRIGISLRQRWFVRILGGPQREVAAPRRRVPSGQRNLAIGKWPERHPARC